MTAPPAAASFSIRPARPEEAAALTALSIRSKAHWGYDADFMRLCLPVLELTPAEAGGDGVFVAQSDAGVLLGVAAVAPDDAGGFELGRIFVEPAAMGFGVGAALMAAIAGWCREHGVTELSILADPNAAAFYERMGAVRTGDAPSDAIPGRRVPTYRWSVP